MMSLSWHRILLAVAPASLDLGRVQLVAVLT